MFTSCSHLNTEGFALIPAVVSSTDCETWRQRLCALEKSSLDPSVRRREGSLYAVRNLIDVFPDILRLGTAPPLDFLLTSVLGTDFGLVRGLLFDKPPNHTWSVPWHQDRTIAIHMPQRLSPRYSMPRLKAGVWHCEAPDEVLQNMLALRIHLDDVTGENGPLIVAPGTHRTGESFDLTPNTIQRIHARAGDVLAMRPLLTHSSPDSRPDTTSHRRVIHLEFAADRNLPDGYLWHWFIPGGMMPM